MINKMKYNEAFINIFNVSEADLNENFTYEGRADWDSMAHFALISELEDSFDVMFETNDILKYGSFNNGLEILKKYGVSFE